jgi:hypothetical protein
MLQREMTPRRDARQDTRRITHAHYSHLKYIFVQPRNPEVQLAHCAAIRLRNVPKISPYNVTSKQSDLFHDSLIVR